MTELETMERAKMYLDKLANGIDPLTDLPVPEGDVVNQVRISRCLFYVSDVLRQVIANGGISARQESRRSPFVITQEQLSRVCFSHEPISVSQLCQRITDAAGQDKNNRLTHPVITDWLVSIGMLEKKLNADGKQARRPTQAGLELGILEEERSSQRGMYLAVLYSEAAQRFIVDNLEAVLQSKKQ